jgi:hypothetical protein
VAIPEFPIGLRSAKKSRTRNVVEDNTQASSNKHPDQNGNPELPQVPTL